MYVNIFFLVHIIYILLLSYLEYIMCKNHVNSLYLWITFLAYYIQNDIFCQ